MKIGIIGLGHAFYKQISAIKKYRQLELVAVCDKDKHKLDTFEFKGIKTLNYEDLSKVCDYVLIASPPDTHLKIAEYFIEHNVGILLEKPIVTNKKELLKLEKLLSNYNKFYNLLHFSFGEEILWYKLHSSFGLPNKIKAYIFDKYVENNSIIEPAVSLCGAYLDETINPLSAIYKLFGKLCFKSLKQKYFPLDKFDYYSFSAFEISEIDVSVEVDWSKGISDKYIDLYYSNKVIRLDSMNQKVIDLTNNIILFEASGDRMANHYKNAFNEFLKIVTNKEQSIILHKELLSNL